MFEHLSIANDPQLNESTINIRFECFGAVERQLPADLMVQFESSLSIADALDYVIRAYPEAGKMLNQCACAIGEDIVSRQTLLSTDTTVVLLSPVAGG